MCSSPPPPRLLTRSFGLLVSAHFLAGLGWSSALLLPLYLAHLGASRTEIGALMATASIGGLLSRPAVGWALDRLGRKPVLAAAILLQALAMSLVAAVRSVGWLAYLQRALFGMGSGSLLAGFFTLGPDLVPAERRTEGIALFGISGLLPLVVNPLTQRLGIDGGQLRWYFPALALVSLLSLVALARLPETRPRADVDPSAIDARATRRALIAKQVQPIWLATVAFAAMVAVFMAFVTVAAERRGVRDSAAVWLSYAAGAVAIRLLGARLPDRLGPHNIVAPAIAAYAAAALVAAQAQTATGFLVAGALGGLGHGYSFPVLTSQVASRCPLALRGAGIATFTVFWDAARLAITPIFGALADGWGDAAMFAALALWAVFGLVGWTLLERRVDHASAVAH
jgi:MFS family permease